MNASPKHSLFGRRIISTGVPYRRGIPLSKDIMTEDNMDLFSRNRRIFSGTSSDESDVSANKVGSAKHAGNGGLDDLLSSNCYGQHDYDWLLSPPGTPLVPSSDGSSSDYSQPASVAPRSSSLVRPVSTTTKTSKISVSQSNSNHPSRPTRSSSVTRSSISMTQHSTYSSNKSTSSDLNTSSSSVSSSHIIKPSTARSSSPSVRSKTSLPSTPLKSSRSTPPFSVPPTPTTSRQHKIHSNINSSAPRSSISRPSTPTRRIPPPSLSQVGPSTGRNAALLARPGSPGPRVRTPPQPIVPPDFPLDTPPNLRTTLPERPLSASRSRPGTVVTLKGSAETPRRQSSPVITRRRLVEPTGRARVHVNGQVDKLESGKLSHASASSMRKPPPKTSSESTGFGRSFSKKSLDMAIRHMDIRNGSSLSLTGSTVFPQSIRLVNNKSQPGRASSALGSGDAKLPATNNGFILKNGNYINSSPKNDIVEHNDHPQSAKLSKVDIYESARYDSILMKEDFSNHTWLHSADDNKYDQGPFFDNGFEYLPEPFFDPL